MKFKGSDQIFVTEKKNATKKKRYSNIFFLPLNLFSYSLMMNCNAMDHSLHFQPGFFSTTLSAKYTVFRITVTWCLKRNIANSPLHTSFPRQSCLLRKMDNQCFLEWLQPEMTMKLN